MEKIIELSERKKNKTHFLINNNCSGGADDKK